MTPPSSPSISSAALSESPTHAAHPQTTWPHDLSHEPEYTIGQVLTLIQREFPACTVSKLRFLDQEGLITPARTDSGYRKYSRADVERVRYILTQQRDSYTPLSHIRQQLLALDAGHTRVDTVPRARLVSDGGRTQLPSTDAISMRELCDLTDATKEEISEYVTLGLLHADIAGYFQTPSVHAVTTIRRLRCLGVAPKNLRAVAQSAERHADIIDHIVQSTATRGRSADIERARTRSSEMAEEVATLYRELVRLATWRLAP